MPTFRIGTIGRVRIQPYKQSPACHHLPSATILHRKEPRHYRVTQMIGVDAAKHVENFWKSIKTTQMGQTPGISLITTR